MNAKQNYQASQRENRIASRRAELATPESVIERTLARNCRRDFVCLVKPALRKLAKQVRREVDLALQPERESFAALMAL